MSSGQTNLQKVLGTMSISCDKVEYGFATIKNLDEIDSAQVLSMFIESEGITVIARKKYLETCGLSFEGPYAKLTIEIHTSLELVGLTAVLATKLADNGISANVVAGYYHDHIFVQYKDYKKAIDALNSLKKI